MNPIRLKYAHGRPRHTPGAMNKTEQAYSDYLTFLLRGGDIEWFKFEGIKLRLADKTFYTPDFFVMANDGTLEAHEVKGHWEDDAKVKIKVAAAMFPIKFIAIKPKAKKYGGGWEEEEF
ncbi:DUF1064 domain-containing protein [Candidatus Pacearchaeota archaeon]|jgi:hypothetical protein|nr:DUF1064 domain-containing protein [Candidatus Pacearchaeota archaeon]